MDTWRELLAVVREANDDSGSMTVHPANTDLDKKFDAGFGSPEGEPFWAWSERFVYFVVCYDGSESVGSVPRNPTAEGVPDHFGGW